MVNRENLKILSDGLLGLTKPVISVRGVKFDMNIYTNDSNTFTRCGTAGCAVGWGPFFGIKKLETEMFIIYRNRCFTDNEYGVGRYLFSPLWSRTDNTKKGAGLRIKYYLEHGLPFDWHEQMLGDAPLSYRQNIKTTKQ